jgi:urea transport system substrate-binding protein
MIASGSGWASRSKGAWLATFLLVAACSGGGTATTAPASAPTSTPAPSAVAPSSGDTSPIKIGLLNMDTGGGSIHAPFVNHAVSVAVDDINAAGGLLGRQIQIATQDSQTDVDTGVDRMKRMVEQDHVAVMFAFQFSNIYHALLEKVSVPDKQLTLNGSLNEGDFCNHYFFSTGATPNQWVDPLVQYGVKNIGPKVYIVGSDYSFGRGSAASAKAAIAAAGGQVVGEEYFPLGTTDFSSSMSKLKSSGANFLLPFVAGNDFVVYLKQYLEFGLKDKIKVVNTIFTEEDSPAFPPDSRAGLLTGGSYFSTVQTPENATFMAKLRAKYGPDAQMTLFGEGYYDMVHLWAQAVQAAGTLATEPVLKALEGQSFQGPQGLVTIDPVTHQATVHSYLGEVQADGTIKITSDLGTSPPKTVVPCNAQSIP